jgi:hypothetical protein
MAIASTRPTTTTTCSRPRWSAPWRRRRGS